VIVFLKGKKKTKRERERERERERIVMINAMERKVIRETK
jgi:hypothetical protein